MGVWSLLYLYMDDILLIGNDVGMLLSAKAWLSRNFSSWLLSKSDFKL